MALRLVPDRPLDDWQQLVEAVPWMSPRHVTGSAAGPGRPFDRPLPDWARTLRRLLDAATLTPVTVDGAAYEILAWDREDGRRTGWLCPPPPRGARPPAFPEHAALWSTFGGIVERFNEPDTWLLNENDSLTAPVARHDASFVHDYTWAWQEEGLKIPITPSEWYSISDEANGNATLCHRESGEVLLWAPDHAYDHIRPLEGCPEYTLYRIDRVPDFRYWVETVAGQWVDAVVLP
ncbi:hypothetical protein [Lapillicoccus jejuensis]|uniref:Uncharacterized protein n=1 Tax=Lapillicoccus jejuensis TaxID=402171 RepID=A0A542E3P1_9MICO|nr:hypothetical protein [Lapillicoccus jejuensis]TQJ09963.1 hypothetical protein FB458_3080 [Lapillicoccus jejuensis]